MSVVLFSFSGSEVGESGSECFIQYTNRSLHPDDWNARLIFCNNSGCASNKNDWNCNYNSYQNLNTLIFDGNILSCAWPVSNGDILSMAGLNSTFRWKPFEFFNGNYSNIIISGPTMSITSEENLLLVLGDVLNPLVEVVDYLGRTITNNVTLKTDFTSSFSSLLVLV